MEELSPSLPHIPREKRLEFHEKPSGPESDSPSETWNWKSENLGNLAESMRFDGLANLSYSHKKRKQIYREVIKH